MADDNWDLHAVVRGCTAATASSSSITQLLSTVDQDTDFSAVWFENLSSHESSAQELQNIHSPFFPQEQNKSVHSPRSALWGSQDHHRHRHRHLSPPEQNVIVKRLSPRQTEPYTQKHHLFSSVVHGSKACGASRLTSWRPKRRKKGLKKVCHVAADNLCCDVWCWRKYGQKSIKGSPYPRGYYRCSTSKGCTARKQVERHRSDPGMFIVTYTAEHNHPIPSQRSSLARVSRGMQKPAAEISNSDADPKKPSGSPAPESRREGSAEGEEDDDDLFAGLEGFAGGEEEGSLSVHFRADL